MVINFSIRYEVPVSQPVLNEIKGRIAELEKMKKTFMEAGDLVCAAELDEEIDKAEANRDWKLSHPEVRIKIARMEMFMDRTEWFCTRPGCNSSIASAAGGIAVNDTNCHMCGAEVIKEEIPMSLDLFRTRTRRTDGVEINGDSK